MALCWDGFNTKLSGKQIAIVIRDDHPLIGLANALPWELLGRLITNDLKMTTAKGFWWLGRKLHIRIHLGVYLLQKIYDLTDRQAEYGVKDNAAYQLFCGSRILAVWHAPDHTKIEEFRNRLSSETQRLLANELAKVAVSLGFADPSETDFDSTVQEANIAYPSDASLMSKLCGLGKKVVDYLRKKTKGLLPEGLEMDMGAVKAKARGYFFMPKNTSIEVRRDVFQKLHQFIKEKMRPIIDICENVDARRIAKMPWNIRRAFDQINVHARRYLLDVGYFTRTNAIKAGKILSFHAFAAACIKKGKAGKDKEFGRVFQLARIKGNFLFVLSSTSIRMNDKNSFEALLAEHASLFGKGVLQSMAADKGYWSAKNLKAVTKSNVKENGLQCPGNIKRGGQPSEDLQTKLRNRRAGIEPLIGHAKHGGQLGKSRMKSDTATLAAGYGSILGLNLRQLIRHQQGKIIVAA